MEAKIYKTKLFVYDIDGKIIGEIENSLDVKDGNINEIEKAVTGLKTTVLKEIESKILQNEQEKYIEKKVN